MIASDDRLVQRVLVDVSFAQTHTHRHRSLPLMPALLRGDSALSATLIDLDEATMPIDRAFVALNKLGFAFRNSGFGCRMTTTYTGAINCLSTDVILQRVDPPEITNGAYQIASNVLHAWVARYRQPLSMVATRRHRRLSETSAGRPSLADRVAELELEHAVDTATGMLRRAARWLPSEVRADELATAVDYLHLKAQTPKEVRPLAIWLGWHMVSKAVVAQGRGRPGRIAVGAGTWLGGGLGVVASLKEVFGVTPDPVMVIVMLGSAGVIGGMRAAGRRRRKRTQE